jgi:hypothetical protein
VMMYVSALPRTSDNLAIGGLLTAATILVTVFNVANIESWSNSDAAKLR